MEPEQEDDKDYLEKRAVNNKTNNHLVNASSAGYYFPALPMAHL